MSDTATPQEAEAQAKVDAFVRERDEQNAARDAKAASEGFTLEATPDPLAVAVDLLRRVQAAGNLPDTLSQAVFAFVKAHG